MKTTIVSAILAALIAVPAQAGPVTLFPIDPQVLIHVPDEMKPHHIGMGRPLRPYSSAGTHWVRPHSRSNGSSVRGHWRSNPDGTTSNNLGRR